MGAHWDEKIISASLRRAKEWAGSNPIMFAVLFALPPFLIPAGISRVWDVPAGLIALGLALLVWFVALMVGTMISMLYEVRAELARHLSPDAVIPSAEFDCELIAGDDDQVSVRVVNKGADGEFRAKIKEVKGHARNGTWPMTVRWLTDETATTRTISSGDSEVLTVLSIRGRRAIDFLRPVDREPQRLRVEALANGANWEVEAVLTVFADTMDRRVGHREWVLRLVFEPGENPLPTVRTLDRVTHHHHVDDDTGPMAVEPGQSITVSG